MAFSSLGNVVVQTLTAARVKQQIAKEGILPFPTFFARNFDLSIFWSPPPPPSAPPTKQIRIEHRHRNHMRARRPAGAFCAPTGGGVLFAIILIVATIAATTDWTRTRTRRISTPFHPSTRSLWRPRRRGASSSTSALHESHTHYWSHEIDGDAPGLASRPRRCLCWGVCFRWWGIWILAAEWAGERADGEVVCDGDGGAGGLLGWALFGGLACTCLCRGIFGGWN